MTLGDVSTPIADGIFDPAKDELRLKDGTTLKNYFRDTLKIKYFQPIDKTRFPLPPSGWCSWYFFYQEHQPDGGNGNRVLSMGWKYLILSVSR